MATYGFDAIGSYLLVVALAALFVAILVWQPFRSVRTVNVWLASGVVGVLLGCSIPFALMEVNGYTVSRALTLPTGATTTPEMLASGGGCGMMKGPGGEGGGCGMTAMAGSSGAGGGCGMTGMASGEQKICPMTGKPLEAGKGMPGMAAAGAQGAKSKSDLAVAVWKLEILTGDIAIALSAEQAAAVTACLKDIEKSPQMSDDEAKAKSAQLMAALNDSQKARLAAIAIPCPAGHEGCSASKCAEMAGGSCPMSVGAAAQNAQTQNPFQLNGTGKAVKSLRERLASKAVAVKTEAPKATPAKTDAPKAEAPKAPPAKTETAKATLPKA